MDPSLLDDIINRLLEVRGRVGKQVQLSESEIRQLCQVSREIFLQQPNLLELEAPIKICGIFFPRNYLLSPEIYYLVLFVVILLDKLEAFDLLLLGNDFGAFLVCLVGFFLVNWYSGWHIWSIWFAGLCRFSLLSCYIAVVCELLLVLTSIDKCHLINWHLVDEPAKLLFIYADGRTQIHKLIITLVWHGCILLTCFAPLLFPVG